MTKHPNATLSDAKLRFWSNVRTGPIDCCWIWEGPVNEHGYGKTVVKGEKEYAHRYSYMIHYDFTDLDMAGVCVLHKCDNPSCVNPSHLFLGTRNDNNQDKVEKGHQQNGEQVPTHKLNEASVRQIRGLRDQGYKLDELAEQFGVAFQTISEICLRKTWKHVD